MNSIIFGDFKSNYVNHQSVDIRLNMTLLKLLFSNYFIFMFCTNFSQIKELRDLCHINMMQPPNIIQVLSVLKKVYFFVHINSGLYKTLDKTRYMYYT